MRVAHNSPGVRLDPSGDGNTLAISAHLEDNGGRGIRPPMVQQFLIQDMLNGWREHRNEVKNPAPYFYTRSGTRWTAGAWVKAANADAGDEFGSSVALSTDGHVMVVGCPWRGQRGDRNQRQSGRQLGRRFRSACLKISLETLRRQLLTPTPTNSQQVSGRGSRATWELGSGWELRSFS